MYPDKKERNSSLHTHFVLRMAGKNKQFVEQMSVVGRYCLLLLLLV